MKLRKRHKLAKLFLTMILAVAMLATTAVSSFAALNSDDAVEGTETNPATAAITKKMEVPTGTTVPSATFGFTLTPVSFDGNSTAADMANFPTDLTKPSITVDNSSLTDTAVTDRIVKIEQSTDVLDGATWKKAGIYAYTVKEDTNTYTDAGITGWTETMTYSPAEYTIKVWVANNSAGTGFYVAAITTEIVVADNTTQTPGTKIDSEERTTVTITDYSQMIFTNGFSKKGDGDDPETTKPLAISKEVAGMQGDLGKFFPFVLTATQPAQISGTETYSAYILEAGAIATITADNYTGTVLQDVNNDDYIEVTSGAPVTINLKHDQEIVLSDAHVGTTYTVSEAADADYTATISLNIGGTTSSPTVTAGSPAVATGLINDAGANSAAYTNTYNDVTPMGVLVENLPFVIMFAIAIGALALHLTAKTKRRADA